MRIRNCVLVLALSVPLPSLAGYDEGIAAYRLGDYSTALSELRPLADQGNADAQWTVGLMYAQGSGVLQDYVQAHKWLNLAAARAVRAWRFEPMLKDGSAVTFETAVRVRFRDE